MSVGRDKAETNRKLTRMFEIVRGENNDLWEIVLKELGVDERTIRHARKKVKEQSSDLNDKIVREEVGFFR